MIVVILWFDGLNNFFLPILKLYGKSYSIYVKNISTENICLRAQGFIDLEHQRNLPKIQTIHILGYYENIPIFEETSMTSNVICFNKNIKRKSNKKIYL